jgi:hypothetical protein
MFATLSAGEAKRALTTADLEIPDANGGPDPLLAANAASSLPSGSTVLAPPIVAVAAPVPGLSSPASTNLRAGPGATISITQAMPAGPARRAFGTDSRGRGVAQSLRIRDFESSALGAGISINGPRQTWEVPLEFTVPEELIDAPGAPKASETHATPDGSNQVEPESMPPSRGEAPRVPEGSDLRSKESSVSDAVPSSALAALAVVLGLPREMRFLRRRRERVSLRTDPRSR